MLDPKAQLVLLPQDREIMDLTGLDEKQYRKFQLYVLTQKPKPGDPVALGFLATAAINLVIGILLTVASSLLAPKAQEQKESDYEESTIDGQDIVRKDRFTAKSGFNSFQNVVELGSVVPIVYANREDIDGKQYGGVRVNTNLLWSQLLSVGGGQFFRGVFLVGEGAPALDYAQLALGNNTLSSYELPPASDDAEAGRVTVYYAPNGGRISENDRVLGVVTDNDPGAQVGSPSDIYQVVETQDFCQALQPSNQTQFGLYDHIGNNFGYKIGEDFIAVTQWQNRSDGEFERQRSNEKWALAQKKRRTFTTRAGFFDADISGEEPVLTSANKGDEFLYVIYRTSEYSREFTANGSSSGGEQESTVNCRDIATTIASIQRAFDERINIGDVYKIGSAIAICTDRGDSFISDVDYDGNGRPVEAKFRVLEAGKFHVWGSDSLGYSGDNQTRDNGVICSEYSQMFRLIVGAFSVERAFKVLEVGLQSNIGLKSSSITNFNSLIAEAEYAGDNCEYGSYQAYVDAEFCGGQDDGGSENESYRKEIRPGTYSGSDTRYSFFRIYVKDIDESDFVPSQNLYSVRSVTGVDVYNYLRFTFNSSKRREFKFIPISSWEIRYGLDKQTPEERGWDDLFSIDPHAKNEYTRPESGYTLKFRGIKIDSPNEEFALKAFQLPEDTQIGFGPIDDDKLKSYVDGYARVAEAFIYSEVTTTANQPEHRISYVNVICENTAPPEYDGMAILGLNISSSKELQTLDQLSVYCTKGVISQHTFPAVFNDLLTNTRYGVGGYFSEEQIDSGSFEAADRFCYDRRYFFDGAVSKKLNLRSWGSERAADFLLELGISGGRFTLNPVAKFESNEIITAMFTAGNIIADTFEMNYFDVQDRLPTLVSVKWREERKSLEISDRGLFPELREVNVKLKETKGDVLEEQIDMSDFCTNEQHAIDRAKWLCLQRQQVTHAVSFKTTPTQASMNVGSIIAIGIETIKTDNPQNGAVASDGTVTCWPPLKDGEYQVFSWNGSGVIQEQLLAVKDGRSASNRGIVFSVKTKQNTCQTYKVQALGFDEDGNIDVEATYFPTDKKGVSTMVNTFNKASAWEIS
jgi:hypothetical protein